VQWRLNALIIDTKQTRNRVEVKEGAGFPRLQTAKGKTGLEKHAKTFWSVFGSANGGGVAAVAKCSMFTIWSAIT
jgi:hypothetical protein